MTSYIGINLVSSPVLPSGTLIADTYNAPNGSTDSISQLTRITVAGALVPVSAALEIQSIDGALLIPRVSTTQKNLMNATNGMIVYDTTLNSFSLYQASMWIELGSTEVSSVTGTANQITATPTTGNVVLSFPSVLHSQNNVLDDGSGNATFASLIATNLTQSVPVVAGFGGALTSSAVNLSASNNVTGILPSLNGGTGVNNGTSTITIGGSVTFSGMFSFIANLSAATSVTFPTSGTLATTANTVSSITGTANQITASSPTGAVTLSFPSILHSANNTLDDGSGNATFASITASNLTASEAVVTNGSKLLTSLVYASTNTTNALVQRDVSGNFSAGTVTASLTGLASLNVPSAGGTITGAIINYTSTPTQNLELVPKVYVDSIAAGIIVLNPVVAASSGSNLNATYNNGASGVGATLTNAGTQVAFSLDGVSPSLNQRILIKDQSSQFQNGIYTLTTIGSGSSNWVLTRSTDFNSSSTVKEGSFVLVTGGTVNSGSQWVETGTGPFTIGTTAIVFTLFNTAANISAGTGLTLTGNVISLNTPVILANGGTNAALTASLGGVVYSTSSALAILAGTATANLPLLSGSSAAPTWGSFALSLGGALTTAGALTTSGAFGATFTFTNTTSVTFPTSGTLTTTANTVSSITGTANQITASNPTGAVTLSFPSVLHSSNTTLDDGSGNMSYVAGATLSTLTSGTLNIGNTTTSVNLSTSGATFASNAGNVAILNGASPAGNFQLLNGGGTGSVTICNSTAANSITIGNETGPSSFATHGTINMNTTGSSSINIGTNSYSGTLSLGNSTSTFTLNSGPININTTGSGSINIASSSYSGTLSIGNASSTTTMLGTININASGSGIVSLGNHTGPSTINLDGKINMLSTASIPGIIPRDTFSYTYYGGV